jgi:hypothetical protein
MERPARDSELEANGLSAICPQCGQRWHGWALSNQRRQWCRTCACGLEIYRDGLFMGMGYSPFTAPPYHLSFHGAGKLNQDKQVISAELFECREVVNFNPARVEKC